MLRAGERQLRGYLRVREGEDDVCDCGSTLCGEPGQVCADSGERVNNCGYKSNYIRHWTGASCTIKAQVDRSGWVAIVHAPYGSTYSRRPSFNTDNANVFRVAWRDGAFPSASTNCSSSCEVRGDTCLCAVHVEVTRVFDALPTASEVTTSCHIGSVCPHEFDAGMYTLIEGSSQVEAYAKAGSAGGGGYNVHTVFRVLATGKCYANELSLVHIDGTSLAFRNPPHFVSFLRATSVDAEHETEAMLDHLFRHANTAPFVAHRLIQRFTTSNPSPRYGGGRDRLLYRRPRRHQLLRYVRRPWCCHRRRCCSIARLAPRRSTPIRRTALREPLLKLHHFLRSMEFASKDAREIEMPNIQEDIGMEAHKSPSVFNFYNHDYQPSGPVADATLVSPEAGLATAPFLIGFLNGMTSLISSGLDSCRGGFGRTCANWKLRQYHPEYDWSDGRVTFAPTGSSAAEVVQELDLLLTGGRLNASATAVILRTYEAELVASASASAALKLAQQLFITAAEFHATKSYPIAPTPRVHKAAATTGAQRNFKAVIVLFFDGGVDSYNMLVPLGNCSQKDLYAEYRTVRGDVKLEPTELLPINTTNGPPQPCGTFGVHKSLDFVHELYQQGDASFVANIGSLIEPVDRVSYFDGSKQLPPQIFAHNMGQKAAQNLHPQVGSSKGVLGRMLDAVSSQTAAYSGGAYSISGNKKILEGEKHAPDIISANDGAVRFWGELEGNGYNPRLPPAVREILSPASTSIYGETIGGLQEAALERSVLLGDALDDAELTASFGDNSIEKQFMQVAKLINVSAQLGTERGAYFVRTGGYDTHSDVGAILNENLGQVNSASDPSRQR